MDGCCPRVPVSNYGNNCLGRGTVIYLVPTCQSNTAGCPIQHKVKSTRYMYDTNIVLYPEFIRTNESSTQKFVHYIVPQCTVHMYVLFYIVQLSTTPYIPWYILCKPLCNLISPVLIHHRPVSVHHSDIRYVCIHVSTTPVFLPLTVIVIIQF